MMNGDKTAARILIIDDIPDTVQLLKDWLENHHFEAQGITSSLKAVETAIAYEPDLILLDVMMPKMDGIETCRQLKADPRTASIPVILVTAKNPSDARSEGIMAGAVDYITKPINLPDLVRRIENALATSPQASVDVQRMLEEIAHSALTILQTDMVWVLGLEGGEQQTLKSRILATNSGSRAEIEFALTVGGGQSIPTFTLNQERNPLSEALVGRKTITNIPVSSLEAAENTHRLHKAAQALRINYLTCIPLIAVGKTAGIMVLGGVAPHNMESPRARQILSSLASQAAIGLDYSRLITNLTQREADMQREQAFREMILDTMSDGLVVIDDRGVIRYVNRRLLRMTNHPRGYLEGRSVGELFHPEDRVGVLVGLLREGIATMKFDQRLVTREGRVIPVWLTRSRSQTDSQNSQVIVLTDMTEQKQRESELERQTGRLQALNRAAHVIASNLSLHETLSNILKAAIEVVNAQGASLFLFNKDNPNELIAVAAVGIGANVIQGVRVPVGEGVAGWVAREAQSQLVADTTTDPRFYSGVDQQSGMQTRSLIAAPLISADQVIGVVEVVNKLGGGMFDENDVHLLESVAGTAAVSIVNARLFDETQRRVRELTTLLNASAAASSTLQFAQVLESIVHNLAAGVDVARCAVMSWNAPKYHLETLAEFCDITWPLADAPRRALDEEPLNRAALSSGLPVVASLLDSDLLPQHRAALESTGMVNMIVVPLWLRGEIVGLADLYGADLTRPYSDADAEQVSAMTAAWAETLPADTLLAHAAESDLTTLVERLMTISQTCWVTVRAWTPGEDATASVRERGFTEWTARPRLKFPVQHSPTIRAIIEDHGVRMVRLDDLHDDPAERAWLQQRGGRSCLIVPLLERGETIGLVKLVDASERIFDLDEIRLAQGIANVVSSAAENARLYQSLESRAKALESAYRELQEADKAKDEFIQNVSHELRTPLIAVLGYANLLAEGDFGSVTPQQSEALDEISRKAQTLADLVQDIVSVQSLDTPTFDCKPVDLAAVLRASLEKYARQAQTAGLRLTADLPAALPPVLADAKAIAEAFEKILDNAIKFGANGEVVEVAVTDSGGPTVQISVRDHGIGIAPEEQQKIFRRFYQVDGGTARRYPGTGLGLAIARSIIEGHGGRISVKSRLNEGAQFIFSLPKYTAS